MWHVPDGGHLAWRITRQWRRGGAYTFHADVQPLYVVTDKLVGDLGVELGHGVPGVNHYFPKPEDPQMVPVADIRLLFRRFAVPHFEKYGRDLKSFVKLPETNAKSRPQRREHGAPKRGPRVPTRSSVPGSEPASPGSAA